MIEFTVPALSCGHCVQVITRALQALDPLAQVRVDLDSRQVRVESTRDAAEFARALDEAGYPPDPA
jgi:copper chaperone